MMKKIFVFLSVVALGLAAASCSDLNVEPTFTDTDAFVEFDKTAVSVAEDKGQVLVSVTLSSLSGLEETISYEAVDGTAKAGVDYNLIDGSATLKFDANSRVCTIPVQIIEHPGEYTGDLKFTLNLKSTGGVNAGMKTSCTVTISDNDHPLAAILGEYTATSSTYGGGSQSWDLTISKDADDVTVIHVDNLTPGCIDYASWGDWTMSAVVNEDKNVMTFSAGQTCEAWYASTDDVFQLLTWTDGIYIDDTEDVIFTLQADGTWLCEQNIWLWPMLSQSLYLNWCDRAPIILTKK